MLRVGLTGSIAVGKSFVARVFGELGCHIIDADELARTVVEPGSEGIRAISDTFGREVLNEDGTLNRLKLSGLVFGDADRLVQLNSLMHPRIAVLQDQLLGQLEADDPNGIAIVEAALLIESGAYKRFSKTVVVFCSPEVQLERLIARNSMSLVDAELRISSQMSQGEKKRYADYLIDTTLGFDDTRRQTTEVYLHLRSIQLAGDCSLA
jgi:dephospho-CoA kinase